MRRMQKLYKLFIDLPNYKKVLVFWVIGPIILFSIFILTEVKYRSNRKELQKLDIQITGIVNGIRTVRGNSTIELDLLSKNLKPDFYKEIEINGKKISTNLTYLGESYAYIKNVSPIVQLKDCVVVNKAMLKIYRRGRFIHQEFF